MRQHAYDFGNLQRCFASIWERAETVDKTATLPLGDIAALHEAGCVTLVSERGDDSLLHKPEQLGEILQAIGAASLTVGRLYEGHVNAARLIKSYGGPAAHAVLAEEVGAGRLLGVWNAERADPPLLTSAPAGWTLSGRKVHCSGAGHVRRPIITARDPDGAVRMLLPDTTAPGVTIDVSVWRATGMRGTATATVDFDNVFVPAGAVVGEPNDYYRSPLFSGGAWRVLAVQLGGLSRILSLHKTALVASARATDPVVRARFAEAAADYECARLLVAEAGRRAESDVLESASIDAYVDVARAQFERLALAQIEAARRNVGLSSFIAPSALDRCIRDLETYLRQPLVDASRDSAARWLLDGNGFDA